MKNSSKMSKAMKNDIAMDKKKGIKQGSAQDKKLDAKITPTKKK